ncbi:MAG TPA: MFS transporter [Gaiellaceae bacterium]
MRPTATGLAIGLAVGYNIANVGPVARLEAQAYGVRLGLIGLLTTALFVTHLVMQIPGGRLVDRHGARALAAVALAIIAAGNAVALIAAWFPLGIVARLIAGVGTGIGFIAGSDYVRATVGTTTAQGLYGAAGVGGGGIALVFVPLTTSVFDWRAPYATALIAACLVLACLPFAPRDRRKGEVRRSASTPLLDIVRDRRLQPLAIAHTSSFAFSVIIGNWTVSLLQDDGYGRRLGGAVAALTLLGGFVTRPLGGRAFQRDPKRAAPAVAASMLAGSAGTVLLLLDVPLGWRILGAAGLGLAAGIPFAVAFSGAQAIRRDHPAAAIGFLNTCATLVIAVGTPLVGATFSLPSDGRVGFAAVAILWGLSSVAVRPSKLSAVTA